jgi:hypothetical protein
VLVIRLSIFGGFIEKEDEEIRMQGIRSDYWLEK